LEAVLSAELMCVHCGALCNQKDSLQEYWTTVLCSIQQLS